MTGGMAYLYDPEGQVDEALNMESLVTGPAAVQHWEDQLLGLIQRQSTKPIPAKGAEILRNWDLKRRTLSKFVQKKCWIKFHPLTLSRVRFPQNKTKTAASCGRFFWD